MTAKISLCMIVKNEGQTLSRCLNSVSGLVHEIIIVDTGSTDSTCDIARQNGAILHHFPWNDNFSDARNASLELAQGDWILFLDGDEEISSEGREVLSQLVENKTVEGYFVTIMNHLGKEGWIETVPDLVFRLFRNKKEYHFRGAIHEQIADVIIEKNPQARYQVAEGLILIHHGYLDEVIKEKDKKLRNLTLIERELAQNPTNQLLQYHYGVELFRAERYADAAAVLIKSANDLDPNTIYLPKLLRYIVIAQHSSGQLQEALHSATHGLKFFPNYADLYYYTGLILLDLKHYSQAQNAFLQALSMPEQPPQYASFGGVRGFRSYYYLAQIAESFLDEEEALKYYLYSLRDNPNFTHALESLVSILKPTKEPEYAMECLEKVCDFCTPSANRLMGDIYFRHGAYGLALKYLDQAEDAFDIKLRKAICLIQERRFFEALRLLEDFPPESPEYPIATVNRLFYFWIQDKSRKVRTLWQELHAFGLAPDTENVISLFLAYSGENTAAPQLILGPEGMLLLLDIVQRLIAMREFKRAMYFLHSLHPHCMNEYYLKIAQLWINYGEESRAIPFLQSFLRTTPSAEAHFQLAEIHFQLEQLAEAEKHYKAAVDLDQKTPRYYIRLINLYSVWRRNILKEALEKYPESDVFKKLSEEVSSNHERAD